MAFLTLDKFDFNGKRVLLRVDINSPVKNRKVLINERIIEHSKTIKELINKKAKLVIIAHQGRYKDKDYLDLKQHSLFLSRLTEKKITYIDDIIGQKAIEKIKSLKDGQAILLKNTRSLKEENSKLSKEECYNSELVRKLQPLFDYFVNDAFSCSHRAQPSIIGFNKIPNIAGRVMEKELNNIPNIDNIKHPFVFLMGGLKIDDCFNLIENLLKKKKVDRILTSGMFAILGLIKIYKKDLDFVKKNKLEDLYQKVSYFMKRYKDRFEFPIDLAIIQDNKRRELIIDPLTINIVLRSKLNMDIGIKTINKYSKIINNSKTIYIKGTPGAYEINHLDIGTKYILNAITKSKAYSLAGGGHTSETILKYKKLKKFSYVSLAGGALIEYLAGKKLPGVESLKNV